MLRSKDKYGLHPICAVYYVMHNEKTKIIFDPLDKYVDVACGNSRLPEEKLHSSDLYTEVFKR